MLMLEGVRVLWARLGRVSYINIYNYGHFDVDYIGIACRCR